MNKKEGFSATIVSSSRTINCATWDDIEKHVAEHKINIFKPDFQPENIIYFSNVRFKSYKERLFKICNIALRTVIKYQNFIENYQITDKKIYYNKWNSFLSTYFYCNLGAFTLKDRKNKATCDLLGYCYSPNTEVSVPIIRLRFFSKEYEDVFWHELAHLILHTKPEIHKFISYDLREFEADFFVYAFNFFLNDIENPEVFNSLKKTLNNVSKKEIKNYNIYTTFLKDYGENNKTFFNKEDLVNKVFYENRYIV